MLLGVRWTQSESCVWFVRNALDLPMPGGKWDGILSRPRKSFVDAQRGDILVWAWPYVGEFIPLHTGIYVARNFILHNGYSRGGRLEDARVTFACCYMANPALRLYEGKALCL